MDVSFYLVTGTKVVTGIDKKKIDKMPKYYQRHDFHIYAYLILQ